MFILELTVRVQQLSSPRVLLFKTLHGHGRYRHGRSRLDAVQALQKRLSANSRAA